MKEHRVFGRKKESPVIFEWSHIDPDEAERIETDIDRRIRELDDFISLRHPRIESHIARIAGACATENVPAQVIDTHIRIQMQECRDIAGDPDIRTELPAPKTTRFTHTRSTIYIEAHERKPGVLILNADRGSHLNSRIDGTRWFPEDLFGFGIGTRLYVRIDAHFPHHRIPDGALTTGAKRIRARLHDRDPGRWGYSGCMVCSTAGISDFEMTPQAIVEAAHGR